MNKRTEKEIIRRLEGISERGHVELEAGLQSIMVSKLLCFTTKLNLMTDQNMSRIDKLIGRYNA